MTQKTEIGTRVFKVRAFWKGFFCLSAPLLLGLFVWGLFIMPTSDGRIFMGIFCLLFAFLFGYMILAVARGRVEIGTEEIRVTESLKTKVFPFDELEGFRLLPTQYFKTLELTRAGSRKKVKIPLYFAHSDELIAALGGKVTNLDKSDYIANLQEVYQQENLGKTPEEKATKLSRLQKGCTWINRLSVGILLWTMFFPRPYAAAIWTLVIFPVVGLLLLDRFSGLVRFNAKRNSAFPAIDKALIMPPIVLVMRSFLDWHLLEWDTFWKPFAAICAGGVIAVFWVRELRRTVAGAVLFLVFSGIFAAGTVVTLNGVLADAPVSVYHARVRDKHLTSGKNTTFYLTLAPWRNRAADEDVTVTRHVYQKYKPGDTAEILVRTGKFGMPFYFVD